jgi:hypothetical protein
LSLLHILLQELLRQWIKEREGGERHILKDKMVASMEENRKSAEET